MDSFSSRSDVQPFYAMDVLAAANKAIDEGRPVISMALGQPSAKVPAPILAAAEVSLKSGSIGYTDALGLMSLRLKIARYYQQHHNLDIPAERIVVTTGSSAAFNLAFLALFDVGDRVAITRPGYPAYRNIMKAVGIDVVEIATDERRAGALTAESLLEAHREKSLKGVLFASPANPTGVSLDAQSLRAIVDVAKENNIKIISDEIYHRLNYSRDDLTVLFFDNDVTVINSFSKYYCMTGWRIGWMVLPENLVRRVECIAQSLYISAPELSQRAAIAAFDATAELDKIKDNYRQSRALFMERLPKMGLDLMAPLDGAFYAYCDISRFTNDSMDFAKKMLAQINVAAAPGLDFDPIEGHRTMRFSYAGDPMKMDEALGRLEQWLA